MSNLDDFIPPSFGNESKLKYGYKDKCPVVLLLDCSGSMSISIRDLNVGVEKLRKDLLANEVAKKSVEISVISFGGAAKVIDDFKLAEDWSVKNLTANGDTPMGEAIKLGLDSLQKRKKIIRDNGSNFYKPWLILITDGYPTDMLKGDSKWNEIKTALNKSSERVCLPWAFGTEQADFSSLKDLFGEGKVFKLKDSNFSSIFQWLSDSLSIVASSTPGDKTKVANPGNYKSISVEI